MPDKSNWWKWVDQAPYRLNMDNSLGTRSKMLACRGMEYGLEGILPIPLLGLEQLAIDELQSLGEGIGFVEEEILL